MSESAQTGIPGMIWHHPGHHGSDIVSVQCEAGEMHFLSDCEGDRESYGEAALELERRAKALWPDEWAARFPDA